MASKSRQTTEKNASVSRVDNTKNKSFAKTKGPLYAQEQVTKLRFQLCFWEETGFLSQSNPIMPIFL